MNHLHFLLGLIFFFPLFEGPLLFAADFHFKPETVSTLGFSTQVSSENKTRVHRISTLSGEPLENKTAVKIFVAKAKASVQSTSLSAEELQKLSALSKTLKPKIPLTLPLSPIKIETFSKPTADLFSKIMKKFKLPSSHEDKLNLALENALLFGYQVIVVSLKPSPITQKISIALRITHPNLTDNAQTYLDETLEAKAIEFAMPSHGVSLFSIKGYPYLDFLSAMRKSSTTWIKWRDYSKPPFQGKTITHAAFTREAPQTRFEFLDPIESDEEVIFLPDTVKFHFFNPLPDQPDTAEVVLFQDSK